MAETASLASRLDLYSILAFLDAGLPVNSEIHQVVLCTLFTTNPAYRVYFLRRSPEDGVYSAIVAVKQERTEEIRTIWNLACWGIDQSAILRLYEAIDVIDWKIDVVFAFNKDCSTHEDIRNYFADRKRLGEHRMYSAGRYVLDIQTALSLQLSLPDGVYVKSLERHHAQLIYDNWTAFKHTTTVEDIADEIDQLPSAGLFLKENDQLVSWVTGHAPMGMSRLYTLDGHRRKGYATLVMQYMSKRMAQSGYLPYVNIITSNTASIAFFQGLGFRYLHGVNALLTYPSINECYCGQFSILSF